jgi:acyl dehydratase
MTPTPPAPLRIGARAERHRTFTPSDVAAYRALCGDAGLRFGRGDPAAVPGPLLAGMISDLLGTVLPGLGTMWLKQTLRFEGDVPPGAEVVAAVEVTGLRPAKGLVNLATSCRAGRSSVLSGEALVLVPDLAARTGAEG